MEKDDKKKREIKIRKKVIITISVILILSTITIVLLYFLNLEFRNTIDIKILRKNISTETLPTIDLDINKPNQISVYSKYIAILNEKKVSIYNNYGEMVSQVPVDINNAIFASSNKYLAIAEDGGKNFYLLLDTTYLWSGSIEGSIEQIHVNQNGYIAIVTSDATYKSIITVYDSEGSELIKKYLSTTRVIDVAMSKDNKYVAIAELDTTGVLIQSKVEIISIENTIRNNEKSDMYLYSADRGTLITKIKYQDKNRLICMYDDHIQAISDNFQSEDIFQFHNATYVSINLNNGFTYVTEESKGLFKSSSIVNIGNYQGAIANNYNIEAVAKEVYTCDNVIAINVGMETYFINDMGLLIKKVTSKQEITNIVFSGNLATIVYKDRVEIINL